MKVTAVAHPIQGLIKYHGLKDTVKRIPFHDSISVCEGELASTTTVEVKPSLASDTYRINGDIPSESEAARIRIVLDAIRRRAGTRHHLRLESKNTLRDAKGLGFSASGIAALGFAANEAFEAGLTGRQLSEVVRLGAGSATRSLAGGFAVWYANRGGSSFAERIRCPVEKSFRMLIAPVHSGVKTDQAHQEVIASPFFRARVSSLRGKLARMTAAVRSGNIAQIGQLAEADTLSLHAVTMTGPAGMILWEPTTIEVIKTVRKLREKEGIPCWFSIDTGPSVFINTDVKHVDEVRGELSRVAPNLMESSVGGAPHLVEDHLF